VSTQSNVMSDPSVRSRGIAAAAIPAARLMYWSIRREFWENRAFYIAPVAVAAMFLFGFSLNALIMLAGLHPAPWLDPNQSDALIRQPYGFAENMIVAAMLVVGLFYAVDALYGERRDRSILFWKSLPLSDLITVLAKASIPILILPLLAFALAVITESIMLLISGAAMVIKGHAAGALWSRLPIIQMWLMLLFHFVAIHGLWLSPVYGWLLMVSAWARRAPILWAVLPPLALGFGEKAAFNTTHFGSLVASRFTGGPEGAAIMEHRMAMASGGMPGPAHFLITPGLWLGFAVAAAFIAGAVRLRRYRGPI
jgi:ABC-2 type transport system permease protein